MDRGIDVACWGEPPRPVSGFAATHVLPDDVRRAGPVLDDLVGDTDAEWILLWDPLLGEPAGDVVASLATGRADACHAGIALGLGGLPAEYDYIHPTWPLTCDPGPDEAGVSWRLSLAALLVRTQVLRDLGGLDPAFEGATGAGLELGHRLIRRGAVIVHAPELVGQRRMPSEPLTDHDRLTFLRRSFGRKWVTYAAARRVVSGRSPVATARAWASSRRACGASAALAQSPLPARPSRPLPPDPSVTVVLPTLGRGEMVRAVLSQLQRQSLAPVQVVVVDQNDPDTRDPGDYEGFDGLPLEVVLQDERGQWVARNAAVQRAVGDWIAFVDDDSEIDEDFLAQHLDGLIRYDADLSTGASRAVVGAPVPENYSYFRVADQWDSGNGMCRRELFDELGLFDQQFDRQRRGDAEFGLRAQRAGRLVVHNPHAVRRHLKAATGGLRTDGSWDGFRSRDRSGPMPQPSILYYTSRYHTRRQAREDLLLGIVTSVVPYHRKRRVGPGQMAALLAAEALHLPSTARRVRLSRRLADRMVADGPRVPALASR
ncbi:MAG: glycosyltransferase family 2 protein [Iamia sp.]